MDNKEKIKKNIQRTKQKNTVKINLKFLNLKYCIQMACLT